MCLQVKGQTRLVKKSGSSIHKDGPAHVRRPLPVLRSSPASGFALKRQRRRKSCHFFTLHLNFPRSFFVFLFQKQISVFLLTPVCFPCFYLSLSDYREKLKIEQRPKNCISLGRRGQSRPVISDFTHFLSCRVSSSNLRFTVFSGV